jgi:hypothetical protein
MRSQIINRIILSRLAPENYNVESQRTQFERQSHFDANACHFPFQEIRRNS